MFRNCYSRLDLFALSAFLLPLYIYLLTLAPSVTFFDSGEFITAVSCLGSPHSPGYPLFVNYAKPFTWLPFANVAFRVNFATAISGALACFGAYLLTTKLLAGRSDRDKHVGPDNLERAAALAAALTFSCTPRLWLQSNHDKPYPLVAFLVSMILFLVIRWRESYRSGTERPCYIYMAAFLSGLGTGAHQTIILMIPAYAFLIFSLNWRIIFRVRDFIMAFIFGVLGFVINLHLPVRATRYPLLNWANPQTKEQFLWHFLRRGYPSEPVERNFSLFWQQVNAFNVPYEFTVVGLLLMIVGMLAIVRRRPAEVTAYFISLFCFLAVIVGYFNTPAETIFLTEEFFTPLYLFSAVFVGIGIFHVAEPLYRFMANKHLPVMPVKAAVLGLVFALPTSVCALNYVYNDQHLNYVAYDYGSNVLRSTTQGTVLYTWGDSGAFPLWYIQGIEKMREDLDIVHTPHLVFDWYLDGFPRLFKYSFLRRIPLESYSPESVLLLAVTEQYDSRPVMIDYSTRYSVPFGAYKFQQRGIVYQLYKDASPVKITPDLSVWDLFATRGILGKQMFFRDLDTGKAILIYANSRIEVAEALIREGRLADGIDNLRMAARISPEVAPEVSQTLSRFGVRD